MAVHYRTKGFVFKKDDLSESDRLFSVFTEDFGKIEVLGRAIRKIASKLKGGIDFISLSEIEFIQGKRYKTLTDAVLIERFGNIKNSLEKIETANNITALLDNLIRGQEQDRKIWDLILEIFYQLNIPHLKSNAQHLLYYYFFWNFFSVLGYLPELYKCAVCQNELLPEELYFSCKEGGVICKKCLGSDNNGQKINSDLVKILRIILKKDWSIFLRLKIDSFSYNLFKKVSDDYYNYFLSWHSFSAL